MKKIELELEKEKLDYVKNKYHNLCYNKTNINRRNQRNIRQYKSKNKIRRTKKNKTHRRYRGT